MTWCEDFIAAFNTHQVEPMLAICAPDIKWEDVSGHIDYEGHDGVKQMIELTLMAIPDCAFTYHGGLKLENSLHGRVDDVGECVRDRLRLPWCVRRRDRRPRSPSCTTGTTGIPGHSRECLGTRNPSMNEVEAMKTASEN